jgi:hypothetical protein
MAPFAICSNEICGFVLDLCEDFPGGETHLRQDDCPWCGAPALSACRYCSLPFRRRPATDVVVCTSCQRNARTGKELPELLRWSKWQSLLHSS